MHGSKAVEEPILPPENFRQKNSGKTWENTKKLRKVYRSVLGSV